MTRLLSAVWHWLTGRSSRNTATPAGPPMQPPAPGASGWPGTGIPLQPLERSIEIASMGGLFNELRHEENRYRGPGGEIIHCCDDRRYILAGCGHPVTMGQIVTDGKHDQGRHLGGLCVYCVREYQPFVERGQLDPLEAERLSMVCSDCAQMTTSGHLSCPRHRIAVVKPTGTTQYVDKDTAKSMARKNAVGKAVHTLAWLFGAPQETESKEK